MKTGIDKCNSTYRKKINTLHRIISDLYSVIQSTKKYNRLSSLFIKKLLEEGRVTKEELTPYFPKREKRVL